MDLEEKRANELVQINQNIEVYKRLLQGDMPEEGKEIIRDEINFLVNHMIPSLKTYDV
jgi:hypothetical protein